MEFEHVSVLLNECLEGLDIDPCGIYIDGTCGGGGHSFEIAKRLKTGRLIGIDRDPDAVKAAGERLADLPAEVVKGNYDCMGDIARGMGIEEVDGILLDLGVSSYQLDNAERGFSYHNEGMLDMRMSKEGVSARDIVNDSPKGEITRILYEYGEEKFAPRIAENIIKHREEKPIETTTELAEIVKEAVPAKFRREKNPCKKTFQALRIAVNGEFEHLDRALDEAFELLKVGGRLCVITFHSLEDRMVKQRFAEWCKGCTCPPDFPVCVCGNTPRAKLINRKPIEAGEEELARNNRSRSAKLRIIERLR
ncbi:MAG: 16S rRNA (cytosine(1402)-N(4))-methyltransferase RsmH [Oscillospiraceae bacterium]|nr:16S rRNA (cytosine(1402)-N(4))-methyltransferase RsmH [Oscillospiraceae bacterium]